MNTRKMMMGLLAAASLLTLPMLGAHADSRSDYARHNAERLRADRAHRSSVAQSRYRTDAMRTAQDRARRNSAAARRREFAVARNNHTRSDRSWYEARRRHDDTVRNEQNRRWRAHHTR